MSVLHSHSRDARAENYSGVMTFELQSIEHAVHAAAELLPSQGPIEVFVHHNTLHAFEHLPFPEAVETGLRVHGAEPYLSEDTYRAKLAEGRIRVRDLEAVLLDDLGEEAELLVANLGTRYALRLAMLQFPLRMGSRAELHWVLAETDALQRFCRDVPAETRRRTIEEVKRWLTTRDSRPSTSPRADLSKDRMSELRAELLPKFSSRSCSSWNDRTWEAFVLQFLWCVCCNGARAADQLLRQSAAELPGSSSSVPEPASPAWFAQRTGHPDAEREVRGEMREAVNALLIQFCSAFLDQGFADWELPERERGLYQTYLAHYSRPGCSPTLWLAELNREAVRLRELGLSPIDSIRESLSLRGIASRDPDCFVQETLLALPGWAGMIWQMETNAEWAVHPAPAGSLTEYLAVRLITERVAEKVYARDLDKPKEAIHADAGEVLSRNTDAMSLASRQLAFTVFQLAQVRGWNPRDLHHLSAGQWATLIREIDSFHSTKRRQMYHFAFEKKYSDDTLNALLAHNKRKSQGTDVSREKHVRHSANGQAPGAAESARALFQVVCCIDDREESFRRHIEEVEPRCETFGVAGFYGIAMYYRGVTDAHFRPLCPVNIKPRHFVTEEPIYSMARLSERQAATRRRIGRATHQAHLGSRSFVGGLLTGFLGSAAAVPLVARILFPRTAARIRNTLGRIVRPPATQLRIERLAQQPGESNGQLGYSLPEMTDIVEGGLRAIGLARTDRISQLVLICGHGSGSVNNPHESAYNCGACSGGRGGPNARAFSQMANDPRVRQLLAVRGLPIPDEVHFVGGFHNTCDDSLTWFDLDQLPIRLRAAFEQAQSVIDEARARSAKERCRRFESVPLSISPADALAHVEGRSEDLSQARPEYNHATCALCFVGRRTWSRGLYLDRRAFLTSYDPTQDGENSPILERLLQAVIPVCAGISLEYYFSTVDNEAYGCGNKLPHNLTSLLGVMTGAASDLRPGLAAQMVEIHEPMRLLFVIDTTREALLRIIEKNPAIAQLVHGQWVQIAVYQPETATIEIFHRGQFVTMTPSADEIPTVAVSEAWFHGHREHMGFASITSAFAAT